MAHCVLLALACSLYAAPNALSQELPVIDMHLHAYVNVPPEMPAEWADRQDSARLLSAPSAKAHMDSTLSEMRRHNVVLAVVSGPLDAVRVWKEAAPDRIIGGGFLGSDGLPEVTVDSFKTLVESGLIGVLGELGLQYAGLSPDDPRLMTYYDYLEEAGVPLALHTGLGPPGGPYSFAPKFRATLGKPTLFEPVKATRPGLKTYLMHAGWPYLDETKAMLYVYPDLYVDLGVLDWALTKEAFYNTLEDLVGAGFGKRLLFGTDQMLWPGAIGLAIDTINSAPFLSEEQKRDILYNNAARFLDLSEATIASHHAH